MTRKANLFAKCPDCDADAACPECGQKIPRFSAFSDWLRGLPAPYDSSRVSLHNLDYIWHNYKENWFITIEEKKNGGTCSPAQHDTHAIVFQLLQIASKALEITHGSVLSSMKKDRRRVEYRGHYVIAFENTSPDDSSWIRINKNDTNKEGLLRLLTNGQLEIAT
jgi:hypothetical protein